jgi:hypothetical protein
MKIKLSKFRILSTGVDGGHYYVISDIDYKGQTRRLVVFFADKADEQNLHGKTEITVDGELVDEKGQSLNLRNARVV